MERPPTDVPFRLVRTASQKTRRDWGEEIFVGAVLLAVAGLGRWLFTLAMARVNGH